MIYADAVILTSEDYQPQGDFNGKDRITSGECVVRRERRIQGLEHGGGARFSPCYHRDPRYPPLL
jgi:hypothetical protein